MKKLIVLVILLSCTVAFAADDTEVHKNFQNFCKEWVSIIKKNKPNQVFCKGNKGVYIAEYSTLTDQHDAAIKRTVVKKTPYIGILKYREKIFKCSAATRERALAGPFTVANERLVTELFVYQDGKWQW